MNYDGGAREETSPARFSRQQMTSWILLGLVGLLVLGIGAVLGGLWFAGCSASPTPGPTSTPTIMPTETPIPPVVTINGLRELAELATVEYWTVTEVHNEVVPDDFRKYLGVKEEILLLVYIKVKAGFDLNKLEPDDIWTDGNRVQLVLPAPEVLSAEIDLDRTHIVYYRKSALVTRDLELERDAMQQAKEALTQAFNEGRLGGEANLLPATSSDTGAEPFGVLEEGALEKSVQYGQVFFENYLRSLGFTEVRVLVD